LACASLSGSSLRNRRRTPGASAARSAASTRMTTAWAAFTLGAETPPAEAAESRLAGLLAQRLLQLGVDGGSAADGLPQSFEPALGRDVSTLLRCADRFSRGPSSHCKMTV
jgi:hypothetical protein